MGVQGQDIVFHQPVAAPVKSCAPFHAQGQILGDAVPLVDHRIAKLMAFDPGARRIKTIGLFHGKG